MIQMMNTFRTNLKDTLFKSYIQNMRLTMNIIIVKAPKLTGDTFKTLEIQNTLNRSRI
jgi:hypothetical protein